MAEELQNENAWTKHMPSEGENPEHAEKQRDTRGVSDTVRSPQNQQAAGAAPGRADPNAARANEEFVKDDAMRYDQAEEQFARQDEGKS